MNHIHHNEIVIFTRLNVFFDDSCIFSFNGTIFTQTMIFYIILEKNNDKDLIEIIFLNQ